MLKPIWVILALPTLLACASIVSKSMYPVTFDSNPTGAKIVVMDSAGNRMFEGTTPTTLTLSSRKGFFQGASYTVEASKEGHHPGRTTLGTGLDGWYIGNILFGGLIGMLIVDPATGAMWKLDDRLVVNLGEMESAGHDGFRLTITTLDQVPTETRDRLVRVR